MKHIPNAITSLRIICAVLLFIVRPFSVVFWALYFFAGISDMADGFIARKLCLESKTGAKMDSAADLIFIFAICVVVIMNIVIPGWLWIFAGIIAIIHLSAYAVGYWKYHEYAALHTYMNKIAGMLLFAAPVLLFLFDNYAVMAAICIVAFISAIEELLINILSKDLNRDYRSILDLNKYQNSKGL